MVKTPSSVVALARMDDAKSQATQRIVEVMRQRKCPVSPWVKNLPTPAYVDQMAGSFRAHHAIPVTPNCETELPDSQELFLLAGTAGRSGQRIRVARCMAGLTAKVAAMTYSLRMPKHPKQKTAMAWISNYESGKKRPSGQALRVLAEMYHVDGMWLRDGGSTGRREPWTRSRPLFLLPYVAAMQDAMDWTWEHLDDFLDSGHPFQNSPPDELIARFVALVESTPKSAAPLPALLPLWPWCLPALIQRFGTPLPYRVRMSAEAHRAILMMTKHWNHRVAAGIEDSLKVPPAPPGSQARMMDEVDLAALEAEQKQFMATLA